METVFFNNLVSEIKDVKFKIDLYETYSYEKERMVDNLFEHVYKL